MATTQQWQERADYDGRGLTGGEFKAAGEARARKRKKDRAARESAKWRHDIFDRGHGPR
jgi:hypothetical protein